MMKSEALFIAGKRMHREVWKKQQVCLNMDGFNADSKVVICNEQVRLKD
jgi:hypothetical protein